MKLGDVKDRIFKLPDIRSQDEFEEEIKQIIELLKEKNFNKTIEYLNFQLKHKEKWAKAFLPFEFTGGIHTTSRAESMNSLIKRYIDSNSEVYDILEFLIDYERKIIVSETKIQKHLKDQYENHPLLLLLKVNLQNQYTTNI